MGVGEANDVKPEPPHLQSDVDFKLDTVVLPEGVCLLDRAFVVIERDPDGKKFDKGKNTHSSALQL